MNYLYGDSTPSTLTSNFLEFLRDALDFAVLVLEADVAIKAGKARIRALEGDANAELERLDHFIGFVADAILSGEKGLESSPTAHCASRLAELCASEQRSTTDEVRAKLAADVSVIDRAEADARERCAAALGALLWPHLPPDASSSLRVVLEQGQSYDATISGQSAFGLSWVFALAIDQDSSWASPLRLERLASVIEIQAPQETGWISKEVKVKPLRIEKHVVTELVSTGQVTHVELRMDPAFESGFDLDVDAAANAISIARVGTAEDPSVGPFEVQPEDAPILFAIAEKLRGDAHALEQSSLAAAAIGEDEFETLPTFVPFVEKLVAMLAPIVREISARSLTPTELILRRALANDRREEFFLAKSTLKEKIARLTPELRAYFDPLALDAPAPPPLPSKAVPASPPDPPMSRTDIASSKPPPPPGSIAPPSDGRNERFVEAVKRIVLVLKSGRTDEGYQQYADLLTAASFAAYRPDDQRQALKMLLLAKPPALRTDPVSAAYRAAISRIQELIDAHADAADYEMLGVAQLQLDEKGAAVTAFEVALKLERARNPTSDLVSNLERRLSQVG
ncbi:hypothetical protein BH09MYX1_BH09MYX1_41960 [soil metagenome]